MYYREESRAGRLVVVWLVIVLVVVTIFLVASYGRATQPGYNYLPLYGVSLAAAGQADEGLKKDIDDLRREIAELRKLLADVLKAEADANPPEPARDADDHYLNAMRKCAACHAPDVAEAKGGGFSSLFKQDRDKTLLNDAIPERDRVKVLRRIKTNDPSFQMPPPKSPPLTDQESKTLIETFTKKEVQR